MCVRGGLASVKDWRKHTSQSKGGVKSKYMLSSGTELSKEEEACAQVLMVALLLIGMAKAQDAVCSLSPSFPLDTFKAKRVMLLALYPCPSFPHDLHQISSCYLVKS